MIEFCLLVGLLGVASNPSPYYAALGLVGGAGGGCLMLMKDGVVFLSLLLFLVYLGGMMIVFGYSAALVAESYPEAWGGKGAMVYLVSYGAMLVVGVCLGGWGVEFCGAEFEVLPAEWWGVSSLYEEGGFLFVGGWVLLLMLFVILEVVGHKRGTLRAV